jgi:hypothetical protein
MKQKTIIEFWNVNKSHKKIMEWGQGDSCRSY